MVLVQNWPFFNLFFRHNRPEKCVLRYSRTKKRLCRLLKQQVQKVEKLRFLQKGLTHGFCPKLAIFPSSVFRQYRPGYCVLRYSRTKKRLIGYKNSKFKQWKNCDFWKGVNPWFLSKIGHFSIFCF